MDRDYKRGEIYYANMGTHNGSIQGGMRPVMIVQNNVGNRFSTTVIVATISTQLHKAKMPTHVILNYEEAGLKKPSFVMLEQIRTVNKTDLGDYLGNINSNDTNKINKATAISLGLEESKSKRQVAEEEHKEKILKNAKRKARLINECEIGIYYMQKKNISITKELREREMYLKDLINYCEIHNIDYKDVYTMHTAEENKVRMVG